MYIGHAGRARLFRTPLGRFTYRPVNEVAYSYGVGLQAAAGGSFFSGGTGEGAVRPDRTGTPGTGAAGELDLWDSAFFQSLAERGRSNPGGVTGQ